MIYTITLNPSIDCYLKIEQPLMLDEVNRADEEIFKIGGKGINVSLDLSMLKIQSTAIVLLGGFTGEYISQCLARNEYIQVKRIPIDGRNRINVKIHQDHKAICVNGKGPEGNPEVQQEIMNALSSLTGNDWVMICGSSIQGFEEGFLQKIADMAHAHGAKLIMDMENLTVQQLEDYHPYLIKPNLYELQLMLGSTKISADSVAGILQGRESLGADNLLVSMGAQGAILAAKDGIYQLIQPNDVAVNKVGAGDAMLAAYIGKLSCGCSESEALRWAGAAGNAVASTLEDIDIQMIESYLARMSVRRIS